MPTTQKWSTVEAITTALTTELNSLANGAQTAASAAIANETDQYRWMVVELVLASLTPTGSPAVHIFLIEQIDGSNYEDISTSALHAQVASLPFSTAVAAKRVISRMFPIPPTNFKLVAQNQAGPSLAAANNTLKYRRFNEQSV